MQTSVFPTNFSVKIYELADCVHKENRKLILSSKHYRYLHEYFYAYAFFVTIHYRIKVKIILRILNI